MTLVSKRVLPFHLDQALACLRQHDLQHWADQLEAALPPICHPAHNGHLERWWQVLADLNVFKTSSFSSLSAAPRIGMAREITASQRAVLVSLLQQLIPWRKGPFDVFGVHIEAEWRSDLKWARLEKAIAPLKGRMVLDVGCGNGYYALRMAALGARWVLGIDPSMLAMTQFTALTQCLHAPPPVTQLPIGVEALPNNLACFDTVFSMGVLYHRRSPFEHLEQLRSALRTGGELVLETLVITGDAGAVLVPKERYAQMRNVWFIPSVAELKRWLRRAGFAAIECVSEANTTPSEQRTTAWMRFHSLSQFLDPSDPGLTVEGYPAPRRAIIVARKP